MSALNRQVLLTILDAAGRAEVPVLLWGQPGLGKSALIADLAAAQDAHLEVIVGSTCEPSDVNGLPVVDADGDVSFAPRSFVRRLNAAERGILFLDELSTAPPASQAAMLRVVRERVVGELPLAPHVRIIAAANPAEQAADGWELAPPMANRFLHLDHAPSADDWFDGVLAGWAAQAAVPERRPGAGVAIRHSVVGFLHTRRELLDAMPDDAVRAGRAWPSRRTWHYLIDVLAELPAGEDDLAMSCRHTAAIGLVGEAAGLELATFLQHLDLPDPHAVLADPTSLDVADLRPDQLFALLGSVAAIGMADPHASDAPDRWRAACEVMGVVADAGRTDVALPSLRRLLDTRPDAAAIPVHALRRFLPMLRETGLLAVAA